MNRYLMIFLVLGVSSSVLAVEPTAKVERGAKPRGNAKPQFQRVDQDGNGTISREEAKTNRRAEKSFDAMDVNKDGQVTEAEYREHLTARMGQHSEKKGQPDMKARWEKADANRDGMLSRDEAAASPNVAKNFDAIDSDKNGQVSEQEIANFMKGRRPRDGRGQS